MIFINNFLFIAVTLREPVDSFWTLDTNIYILCVVCIKLSSFDIVEATWVNTLFIFVIKQPKHMSMYYY